MRWSRRLCVSLVLVSLAGPGCTIYIGPYDESAESAGPTESVLPEPKEPRGEEAVLTEEQQTRQEEADRYIADVIYKGYSILETTQGYSGDLIDWIDSDTLPDLPSSLPELPWSPEEVVLPEGVELAVSELEKYPELLGPAGTTPFSRPDFSMYVMGDTGATSVQDWLDHYQVHGSVQDPHRLYAGLTAITPNRGVSGYVNQFMPFVAEKSLSLIELVVACPAEGPPKEWVGVAISIDRANFLGEPKPRLRAEYVREVGGKLEGVWDMNKPGFVPYRYRKHVLGKEVPVSQIGGMQVEHRIDIFQAISGDWWIAYQGSLIGYYPASLFTLLNQGGCSAHWYGEVSDPELSDGWTKTDMGSKLSAEAGLLYAAYVRQPAFRDSDWYVLEVPATNAPKLLDVKPYKAACYSRSPLYEVALPWGAIFFLGGDGGDTPECTGP